MVKKDLRKNSHSSGRSCNISSCLQRNELMCRLRDVERRFIRIECDDDVDYHENNNVDANSDGYGSGGDDDEIIRN